MTQPEEVLNGIRIQSFSVLGKIVQICQYPNQFHLLSLTLNFLVVSVSVHPL